MFKGLFSSGSSGSGTSSDATKQLESVIQSMVKAVVDEPDQISLNSRVDDDLISFELKVAKADLGKVIGRKGRTASAMRTLLGAASRKYNVGADLKILD